MNGAFGVCLLREPRCGALARRLLEEHFDGRVDAEILSDAKLIASELVNNAYLHRIGVIELNVQMADGRLRIDVGDQVSGPSCRSGRSTT
jgi:anti-sigma regulatory factor (Ser/Thr protein kinase)